MSTEISTYQAQLNGRPVNLSELTPLAFAGFAHFSV